MKYTTITRATNDMQQTHLTCVEAESHEEAVQLGRAECAKDWEQPEDGLQVIGLFEGDVTPVQWDDQGLDGPYTPVITSFKVQIGPNPYLDKWVEEDLDVDELVVDGDAAQNPLTDSLIARLEELDVGDDPHGSLVDRVQGQVITMVEGFLTGISVWSCNLTLCTGKRKDPDDENSPLEEVGDVDVWLVMTVGQP